MINKLITIADRKINLTHHKVTSVVLDVVGGTTTIVLDSYAAEDATAPVQSITCVIPAVEGNPLLAAVLEYVEQEFLAYEF